MDGEVLFSAFTDEFKDAQAPKWLDTYEQAGTRQGSQEAIITPLDDHMVEKLRALGYTE